MLHRPAGPYQRGEGRDICKIYRCIIGCKQVAVVLRHGIALFQQHAAHHAHHGFVHCTQFVKAKSPAQAEQAPRHKALLAKAAPHLALYFGAHLRPLRRSQPHCEQKHILAGKIFFRLAKAGHAARIQAAAVHNAPCAAHGLRVLCAQCKAWRAQRRGKRRCVLLCCPVMRRIQHHCFHCYPSCMACMFSPSFHITFSAAARSACGTPANSACINVSCFSR